MEWHFVDVFSNVFGQEVHLYKLVNTETGEVLTERYVNPAEELWRPFKNAMKSMSHVQKT